jgi:uncharacterized protein YxjI
VTDDSWARFRLRRKLFSIGEDYWVENDRGEPVFKVDGKVLRLRETFELQDRNGSELATIEAKLIAIRPTMRIERGGRAYATVRKALFTPLRQRYAIEVLGGGVLEAQGDITDHEYEVSSGGDTVARISKRWFSLRDTYGVAVAPGQDEVLILAAAVCIDEMSEREHEH